MLEKLKHFFDNHIAHCENADDSVEKLKVASAALFMEMLHMEKRAEPEKLKLIQELLETAFNLSEPQTSALIELAEQRRAQATDYFEFTHFICIEFNRSQKIQLLESLWKIALIDRHLDAEEEYLADKVARLLFIPHDEVLQARNRVKDH